MKKELIVVPKVSEKYMIGDGNGEWLEAIFTGAFRKVGENKFPIFQRTDGGGVNLDRVDRDSLMKVKYNHLKDIGDFNSKTFWTVSLDGIKEIEKIDIRKKLKSKKSSMIDTVILDGQKKEHIFEALVQSQCADKIFDEWGFSEVFEKGTAVSMIFYGVPGTGKTMMCDAIADTLDVDLLMVTAAEIETSTPGGAERNIKKYFDIARGKIGAPEGIDDNGKEILGKPRERVLLFDECDSLISSRANVGMIIASQINVLLQEIERFEGVVLFTTNRLGKLDPALESRLSVKIEFPFPDADVRERIWKRMIPKKAPVAKNVDYAKLALIEVAGRNIKNIVLGAARQAAMKDAKKITMAHFKTACEREVQGLIQFKEESK